MKAGDTDNIRAEGSR